MRKRLAFFVVCILAFSIYYNFLMPENRVAAAFPSMLSPSGMQTQSHRGENAEEFTAAQSNTVLPQTLVVGGNVFGVRFFTEGVLVVALVDIQTERGGENPAFSSGIRVRDIILKVDGKPMSSNEELQQTVLSSGGKTLNIIIKREQKDFEVKVTPVAASDGTYKIGALVRDSTAGIGTITYYNPIDGSFGALGHGICDPDTSELFLLRNATAFNARAYSVVKGEKGAPGEIRGIFDTEGILGNLTANTDYGVFGTVSEAIVGQEYPVAAASQVQTGAAQIICTLDDTGPQFYDIEITRILKTLGDSAKNMSIKITDPKLLEKTGGIVQGMSGSPIIQNNMIVGAVTHVLVNDPASGYGVFIENMLKTAQQSAETDENKAAA